MEDEGSPRKLLIFLFHWRTMLETERAPDSGSEEVVLAETSAPESSMAGFWLILPATRSDMGLARRRSADTCPEEGQKRGSQLGSPTQPKPIGITPGAQSSESSSSIAQSPGTFVPHGVPSAPSQPTPTTRLCCSGWGTLLLPTTISHPVPEP